MPRPPRADEAGAIYHALNRGNARHDIFFKTADYQAFERLIAEGLDRFPVDLFAYQWMKNHWHMVLSPRVDGGMSAFIGWLTLILSDITRTTERRVTATSTRAATKAFQSRTTDTSTRSVATWSAMR